MRERSADRRREEGVGEVSFPVDRRRRVIDQTPLAEGLFQGRVQPGHRTVRLPVLVDADTFRILCRIAQQDRLRAVDPGAPVEGLAEAVEVVGRFDVNRAGFLVGVKAQIEQVPQGVEYDPFADAVPGDVLERDRGVQTGCAGEVGAQGALAAQGEFHPRFRTVEIDGREGFGRGRRDSYRVGTDGHFHFGLSGFSDVAVVECPISGVGRASGGFAEQYRGRDGRAGRGRDQSRPRIELSDCVPGRAVDGAGEAVGVSFGVVEHDGTVLEGGFGRVSAVGVAVCEGALYLGAVAQVEGVDSFEAVAVEDAVVGDVADVVFEGYRHRGHGPEDDLPVFDGEAVVVRKDIGEGFSQIVLVVRIDRFDEIAY